MVFFHWRHTIYSCDCALAHKFLEDSPQNSELDFDLDEDNDESYQVGLLVSKVMQPKLSSNAAKFDESKDDLDKLFAQEAKNSEI